MPDLKIKVDYTEVIEAIEKLNRVKELVSEINNLLSSIEIEIKTNLEKLGG